MTARETVIQSFARHKKNLLVVGDLWSVES
jgi:hypothetical protein